MSFNSSYQKGQALLIFVLIIAVALTIGLALATQSLTNLRTSTEEENSQRAFSAAEAGIELKLKDDNSASIANIPLGNNAKILTASVIPSGGQRILLNNGAPVQKDDGVDLWLTDYPSFSPAWPSNSSGVTASINVYWGTDAHTQCSTTEIASNKPAIEVILVSGTDKNNPTTRHVTADPCSARSNLNKFANAVEETNTVGNITFRYRMTVSNISQGLLMRIIPLYSSTPIAVASSNSNYPFPSQGKKVEAIGESGGTQRKLVVFESHPKYPVEIFPYMLFSPQ